MPSAALVPCLSSHLQNLTFLLASHCHDACLRGLLFCFSTLALPSNTLLAATCWGAGSGLFCPSLSLIFPPLTGPPSLSVYFFCSNLLLTPTSEGTPDSTSLLMGSAQKGHLPPALDHRPCSAKGDCANSTAQARQEGPAEEFKLLSLGSVPLACGVDRGCDHTWQQDGRCSWEVF